MSRYRKKYPVPTDDPSDVVENSDTSSFFRGIRILKRDNLRDLFLPRGTVSSIPRCTVGKSQEARRAIPPAEPPQAPHRVSRAAPPPPGTRSGQPAREHPASGEKGHSVFQGSAVGRKRLSRPVIATCVHVRSVRTRATRASFRSARKSAGACQTVLASDKTSGLTTTHHALLAGLQSAFIQGRAADSSGCKFTSY